jgi:hypothetical protein
MLLAIVLVGAACPLWANSGHETLFDHLVGTGEQRRRYIEADHFGRLQIDDEFEPA